MRRKTGFNENEWKRQRYARLKAAGTCVVCGVEKATCGVRCPECRRKYQRKYLMAAATGGICTRCLKNPADEGYATCAACREYSRWSASKSRSLKRAKNENGG